MKSATNYSLTTQMGIILAEWFADQIRSEPTSKSNGAGLHDRINLIVPISQHWFRRYHERYNQAEVLAQAIATKLNCPIAPRGLVRIKWSDKQGTKTIQERLKNMQGTMLLQAGLSVAGKRVLVVDDILTSGATASEAARVLKLGGSKSVDVLTFARGASAQN